MLELAYLNQSALKEVYARKINDERYKYYFLENYFEYDLSIDKSDWRRIQYVSKSNNGQIFAYLGAWVNRGFNIVDRLEVISFHEKPNPIISRDILRFLDLLLNKKGFRKIIFTVASGNPAMDLYRRCLVDKGKGIIVGIVKDYYILTDGKMYDQVIFEISQELYNS